MDEKTISAFDYAIDNGDTTVLDALVKKFDLLSDEDKKTLLFRTFVRSNSLKFVQHVLNYGYSLDYKAESNETLLHYASGGDNAETVKYLIEQGLPIEAKDNDGLTPLFYAAQYTNNVDVLKCLIAAGADKNIVDSSGETLLIAAAGRNPNPEITEFLLEQGFDIEARDNDGFTPILNAALWQSNADVISLLAEAGANITAKTNDGSTMFHLAAHNENLSVVRYISNAFCTWDVDNDGFSCLRTALVKARSPEVIKLFLRKMKMEHIQAACFNETPEILEALILSGYDVNSSDEDGVSTLMTAAHYNNNPSIIRMLRYYDVIWNNTDIKGRTALHHAAANSEPAIYQWMLEDDDFKTLMDKTDNEGHTPDYYREHQEEF